MTKPRLSIILRPVSGTDMMIKEYPYIGFGFLVQSFQDLWNFLSDKGESSIFCYS